MSVRVPDEPRRCDCRLGGREETYCDCPGIPDRRRAMIAWVSAHTAEEIADRLLALDAALGHVLDGVA